MCRACEGYAEDDETWRVEQVEDAMMHEAQYADYLRTCAQRDALDAAFTAAGVLPVATTRRIRLTEAL